MELLSIQSQGAFEAWVYEDKIVFKKLGKLYSEKSFHSLQVALKDPFSYLE